MQAVLFWITLDFEAFNILYDDTEAKEKTKKIFHQEGNSFAYAVVKAEHYYKDIRNATDMVYDTKLHKTKINCTEVHIHIHMSLKLFEYLDEDIKEIIKLVKIYPKPYVNSPEL